MKTRAALQIPSKIARNKDLLRSFLHLGLAGSAGERIAALQEITAWMSRKRIDIQREQGLIAATGVVRDLLDTVEEVPRRLDSVPHLGCLADVSQVPATRLDYVSMQLATLLEMKRASPGLGLGSANGSTDAVRYRNKSISGLELAQLWAVLLNVGHLFGTFATERALLFELERAPKVRRELVASVGKDLGPSVEALLRSGSVYRVSHALSAWWVTQQMPHGYLRNTCLEALRRYLSDESEGRVGRIRHVFRLARQVSYLRLHECLQIGSGGEQLSESLLAECRTGRGVALEVHSIVESPALRLLNALCDFQYRSIFASANAAGRVLKHMREFRRWWEARDQRAATLAERLQDLNRRPADWPAEDSSPLPHFARIDLPGEDGDLVGEVQKWRGDGARWKGATLFVSSSPFTSGLTCDVFADDQIDPVSVHRVSQILAQHCVASWSKENDPATRALWQSLASWGAAIFKLVLKPTVDIFVRPAKATKGSVGYAIIAPTRELFEQRMRKFLDRIADDGRRDELQAVVTTARSLPEDGIWFAFLGETHLVDRESQAELQEIDGLWGRIHPDRVTWSALECKTGATAGAAGQLADIGSWLTVPVSRPERQIIEGATVFITTFGWPTHPMRAADPVRPNEES